VGICKYLVLWSGKANSISEISEILKSGLTKKEKVPYDEEYLGWLKKRPNEKPEFKTEEWILTQLQDYYTYHHPSQTGWLSKHGFKEYAESLPRNLGLVDSNYNITDMGLVLHKGLMDDKEAQALSNIKPNCNPFLLTIEQKVFFLYNFLVSDGDFLIPFAYAIYKNFSKETFSYLEAGNLIPKLIDDILPFFSGLAYSSSEREQLADLENMKLSIQRHIKDKSEKKGSGSRREQECIARLEWMVDLGILTKNYSRTYAFTKLGKSLVTHLGNIYNKYLTTGYPDQAVLKIVDSNFYEIINLAYFSGTSTTYSNINLLKFIKRSYNLLRGISGYCLYRPLLLLANILSSSRGEKIFLEYDNGIKLLEKAFQKDPEKIYYTTDRFGTDVQVKIG
jgi:hypothetical protein